jgi:MFS family permease
MPATPTEQRWSRSVVAFFLAVLGTSLAATALTTILGKLVFDITGSELDLGLLGLAEFAPAALLVLVSGSLADRRDRRTLAAASIFGEAVAAAGIAWYASTDPTSVTPIFALILLFGIARALAAPATRALPGDIVTPSVLPWLMVRRSATWQLASIVGPVLGGVLYAVDITLPFVAVVGFLLLAAVAMLSVRPLPATETAVVEVELDAAAAAAADVQAIKAEAMLEAGVEMSEGAVIAAAPARGRMSEAMEGLRFIRRQPVLLGAISLDLFAVLFGGAVALLPAIAEDRLHVGAVGLGWLRASIGIGAALVTILLAWKPVTRQVGAKLLAAVAVFGVFTIVLGVTTSFVIAFVALLVLSGADAISVFIRATLVPLVTPNETRGRVLAVENVFIGASNELGAFESGVVGQLFGTVPAVVLGGAATLAVAAIWWKAFPALRKVDRFPGA